VYHPEWLDNPVLVKKKNVNWRMCVDYTSIIKACSKDLFALPHIDQVVDSTAGCETLCFLGSYSGHHQIAMDSDDQLTTTFITHFGCFCYSSMPFGSKNAGASYQRCKRRVFNELIGQLVEAYVNDINVKSMRMGDLVPYFAVVFEKLRKFQV
jgi:hypothetical protein